MGSELLDSSADADVVDPVEILQHRLIKRGKSVIRQGLVRWRGMAAELATWEDLRSLHQRFPEAPAWGQASS